MKVDVYSPIEDPQDDDTDLSTYFLAVIGFDDPGEVSLDVGGNLALTLPNMLAHAGSSSYEIFSSTETSAGDPFGEVTLSGTFAGSHQYIGVFLGVRDGGGAASSIDYTGFDDVRLTLIDPPVPMPEPTTLLLMTVGLAGLGLVRPRRRSRS